MHFGFTSSDTLILLLYIGCIVKPQCTASQTDSQTDVRHYRVNSLYWSSNNNLTDGSTARTCAWQKQDVGTKHICTSWMTLSHGSQWLAGLGRGLSAGLSSSCRACTFIDYMYMCSLPVFCHIRGSFQSTVTRFVTCFCRNRWSHCQVCDIRRGLPIRRVLIFHQDSDPSGQHWTSPHGTS